MARLELTIAECQKVFDAMDDHVIKDKIRSAINQAEYTGTAKPCPFCGSACDVQGWMGCAAPGEPMRQGPECSVCGATADSLEAWNRREP